MTERTIVAATEDQSSTLLGPGLLLGCSILGFWASNSHFLPLYQNFLSTKILFGVGEWTILHKTILHLINDGLMAVFFLFVGLELKREVLVGELSDIKQATIPIFAALGGMIVPALIYFSLNPSGEVARGWGIPMATDIAFALGVLAVLGNRVPASLKVMLTAIAIVDDLGAILVIALFYTNEINTHALLLASAFFGICIVFNRIGIMRISVYLIVGLPLWYFMLKSGIHATIAGVLLAGTIPLAPKKVSRAKLISDILSKKASPLDSPGVFLEKSLLKWISFVIIPLFAFCNSGVLIEEITFGSISFGIILGLVLGKPLGIIGGTYLTQILGIANLPKAYSWRELTGVGFVAGIGFTMSLFISSLAFESPDLNNQAKFSILIGSLIAGLVGVIMLVKPVKNTR